VVGHDWGARAAYIASVLAPERITHCVALSVGWGTNDPGQRLPLKQVQNYWYHWYMALDRGAALVRDERRELTRYIWTLWNPGWRMSDEEFAATAASFDNPDWAEVVLHSYRVRWGWAPKDPAYADLEALYELIARLDDEKDIYARPITVMDRKTHYAMDGDRAFDDFRKNTLARHSEILDACQELARASAPSLFDK